MAARPVTAQYAAIQQPLRRVLGIRLAAEVAEEGARIIRVDSDTPAAKAGLKVDDLILSVAGEAIQDVDSLQNIMQHHRPGEVVTVRVKRGSQMMELEAKLTGNRGSWVGAI